MNLWAPVIQVSFPVDRRDHNHRTPNHPHAHCAEHTLRRYGTAWTDLHKSLPTVRHAFCPSPGASFALSRPTHGVVGPVNRDLRREVELSILCFLNPGTEQYLVLAGNTNRSQLKSANLQSCLHARLLRKWIPDLVPAAIAIGSILLDC